MNFKYIRNFFDTDERFSYMHDLLKNKMDVHIANGQSFIIKQEKYSLFKAIYALPDNPFLKVSFNISDEESFRDAIETIYKSATASDNQPEEAKPSVSADDIELALDAHNYAVAKYLAIEGDPAFNAAYGSDVNIFISREKDKWVFQCKYLDETKLYKEDNMEEINSILLDYSSLSDYNKKQSKEAIKYPRGGNTMYKQTVNKSFDFLNDYKVVKLAERAINDNFAELANDFIKYSNSEKDSGTILSCGNSKVLFSSTKFNRKITIEFGRDGEEPFRYVYTNKGINLLNDYDPAALITIGNLIESAVDAWLENDENRMNIVDLNERLLSVVDNIKTMIGLINTTIGKYNA
jgi:hypothetical protein